MTFPALLLALLVALLCGMIFHIIRGGDGGRLLLYLGLSVFGFTAGQLVSLWRGWNFFSFGSLEIGIGVIGSAVMLVVGEWLGRTKT